MTLANGLILLGFAVMALLLLFYQRERPAERVFSANGYTEAVEKYIVPYLQYNPNPAEGERVVELSQIGDVPDAVWKFFQNSYLRRDIEANDPKLWDIRNSDVKGIDPNAHNVLLPIRSPRRWQGEISFQTDNTAVGEIVGNSVELQTITLLPFEFANVDNFKTETVLASNTDWSSEIVTAHEVQLMRRNGAIIAKLFVLGDQILIRAFDTKSAVISIDGYVIDDTEYRTIPAGAELLIDDPTGVPAVFTSRGVRGATNTLSGYRSLIGRSFDPRLQEFSGALVSDMNRLLGALHNGLSDNDAKDLQLLDVAVTLDPELHQDLQDRLEFDVSQLAAKLRRQSGYDQPIPASITVMDALNGDIIAIASTPNPDDLSNTARATLRSNQNFVNHPIGSVAKPLVSAAILETWPALTELKVKNPDLVDNEHIVTDILGFEMELGTGGNGVNWWITYEEYLTRSSNVYAAYLMFLAMTENPVGSSTTEEPIIRNYVIQPSRPSNEYRQVPARAPKPHYDEDGTVSYSVKFEWPRELRKLYQIEVEKILYDAQPTIRLDPFWQKSIWDGLLDDIEDLESDLLDRQSGALRQLSPEMVNLNINQARHIRRDLVSLILGAGESRWNTIKVAEAYGRLVTGRRVVASLVDRLDDDDFLFPTMIDACEGTGDPIYGRPSDGNFCSSTREASLRGLFGVTERGTGISMRRTIRDVTSEIGDDQYVCVFAKTGTPQIVRSYQRRIDRVVTALGESSRRYLRISDDESTGAFRRQVDIVLTSGERIPHNRRNFEAEAARAIRSDAGIMQHLEYQGVTPTYLARHINRYNQASPGNRSGILVLDVERRRVRGRSAQIDESKKYWGKAFAFVVATYAKSGTEISNAEFCTERAFRADPEKAYSVAVNVPAPDPDPEPDFAVRLGSFALEQLQEHLR